MEKILGRKGRRSGGKKANRERGEKMGKALGGEGWEGYLERERGQKGLREEKGEDLSAGRP